MLVVTGETTPEPSPEPSVAVPVVELTQQASELGELRARVEAAEREAREANSRAELAETVARDARDAADRLASATARAAADVETTSEPSDAPSASEPDVVAALAVVPDLPPPSDPTPESTRPRGFLMRLLLGK